MAHDLNQKNSNKTMRNILIFSSTSLIVILSLFAHFSLVTTTDNFPHYTKFEGGCSEGFCNDVIALAENKLLVPGGTLPLVFVDIENWTNLLNNFVSMSRVSKTLPAEIGVVCMDEHVLKFMRKIDAPPCYYPGSISNILLDKSEKDPSKKITELWYLRVLTLRKLLGKGYGVLLFDSDAIWQLDLKKHNFGLSQLELESYDLIASRGSFPNHIGKHWGATLCMGYIYFRPTQASLLVVDAMLNNATHTDWFDDQNVLNEFLYEHVHLNWTAYPRLLQVPKVTIYDNWDPISSTVNHRKRRSVRTDGDTELAQSDQNMELAVDSRRLGYATNPKMIRVKIATPTTNRYPISYLGESDGDIGVGKMGGSLVNVLLLPHKFAVRRCERAYGIGVDNVRSAAVVHCNHIKYTKGFTRWLHLNFSESFSQFTQHQPEKDVFIEWLSHISM